MRTKRRQTKAAARPGKRSATKCGKKPQESKTATSVATSSGNSNMVPDVEIDEGGAPQTTSVEPSEEISCAICTEIFKEPKLLHCMHSFCDGCIDELVKRQEDQQGVMCPICRFVTKAGPGGILKLWRNHIIEQKVKWYEVAKKRENSEFKCSECEAEAASRFCVDCPMKLCDSCATHHKKCIKFKEHNILGIEAVSNEELVGDEAQVCSIHSRNLELFCEACQVSVCSDCVRSISHRSHTFLPVDEVLDNNLKTLTAAIADSEKCCLWYDYHFGELDNFNKLVAEGIEQQKKHLEDIFSELIDMLQNNKKKLYSWLENNDGYSADQLDLAKERVSHVKSMTEYLKEVTRLPKGEMFHILKDGVSQLKNEVGSMKAATWFSARFPNSLKDGEYVMDGKNEFDVSIPARVINRSVMIEKVKSSIQLMGLLPHEKVLESEKVPALARFDGCFKFRKSVLPHPVGTVKFKVNNLSKINVENRSPLVEVGNFFWRIRIIKTKGKKWDEDERAGWFLQCTLGNGNDLPKKCTATHSVILKSLTGGEDYKTPSVAKVFHPNTRYDSWGNSFKKLGLTSRYFLDKGILKDDAMEIHALVRVDSWEDDLP